MRLLRVCGAALALVLAAGAPAFADGGGHGHGHHGHGDWGDDWDDDWGGHGFVGYGNGGYTNGGWVAPAAGPCRVEREWRPNGAYREEVDCRGRPAYVPQLPVFVAPAREPSLTIVIPLD